MSPKTSRRRLTSLRSFAKWAGWSDEMTDLAEHRSPSDVAPQPHPIPEGIDGVRRLIDGCTKAHHKALIALCGLMGLRVSEALACDVSWFDFEKMQCRVLGKGDKTRFVPISDEAFEHLAPAIVAAHQADGRLVPCGDRSARSFITRLGVKVGLQRPISSHDLRATFATSVHDKTLNMNVVRELLGHGSVETTQGYVKNHDSVLHDAVNL